MPVTDQAGPRAMEQLLQQTVTAHVSPEARVVRVDTLPAIPSGMSGAAVRRYEVVLDGVDDGESRVRLVSKSAELRERRVLAWLGAQRQPNVPFCATLDLTTDGPALVCLQDVGDTRRPTSLEPITDEALQQEAEGLAAIHHANLGRSEELAWLPRIDRSYVSEKVVNGWWRPHWRKMAVRDGFRKVFGAYLAPVEAAAEQIADEMSALLRDADCHTLVHTDINPSNVLVQHGTPFYIDWQVAHYGPLYLDLPHHFCTLRQAEHYRRALAAQGSEIPAGIFEERYRVAARVIGLRYMWWTLENWEADPSETAWVLHYINLVLGNV
jgi:aminoglycoside phosphotransferase (APT) family kinase protein